MVTQPLHMDASLFYDHCNIILIHFLQRFSYHEYVYTLNGLKTAEHDGRDLNGNCTDHLEYQ